MVVTFPASRVETRKSISPSALFSPPTHRLLPSIDEFYVSSRQRRQSANGL
jgi:hypothetical protein